MLSPISSLLDRVLFGPDTNTAPARSQIKETGSSNGAISPVDSNPSDISATPVNTLDSPHEKDPDEQAGIHTRRVTSIDSSKPLRKVHPAVSQWQKLWRRPEATWHPTFFQIRPIAGIIALCVTILCTFASLAILVSSDGDAQENWPIQPTVYLAIVTAIANSALALARMEAIPISWWYSMSRGRSVASLERQWQTTRSVVQAIRYSRYMSLLNIACIAGAFVVVDGPFLQRASTIVRRTVDSNVTLGMTLSPELPTGFSGYYQYHILWNTAASGGGGGPTGGVGLALDWIHNKPIPLEVLECTGTCRAKVLGPGVERTNCTSQSWPITPEMVHNFNATWGPWKGVLPDPQVNNALVARLPAFYVRLWLDHTQPTGEAAILTTGLVSWFDFAGEYVQEICYLLPAIVEYDVIIEDNTVSVPHAEGQGRVVELANNTHAPDDADPAMLAVKQLSTIDNLVVQLSILVNTNASVAMAEAAGPGAFYSPDPQTYNLEVVNHMNNSNGAADLNFEDPTPGIVYALNQLMFRGAAISSLWPNATGLIDPDVSVNQTVGGVQTLTRNVFKSDLTWYAAAAVFELFTVLVLLPMFFGWWALGCNLTLSPFAIALAFDSPLLKDVNSASGARGVVEEVGAMKLKLGVVNTSERTETPEQNGYATGRLGVAESRAVARPRNGLKFRE